MTLLNVKHFLVQHHQSQEKFYDGYLNIPHDMAPGEGIF
jgi:hypothetical protein